MPKRLTTALVALLAFAAVLAVVPIASPVSAHEQTTTKRYCSYDPFAGKQCWTKTVAVAHHHPPANQPCPAGTTGTPPDCLPVPSDNSRNKDSNKPKTTTTTAAPPTTQPPECPPGTVGTYPDCKKREPKKCSDGQTGTPPNCKTPPVTCKAGEHRYGTGCHAHSFVAPCGDGTWVPHTGHTPIKQKPCPTQQDLKATTYTVKPCTPYQASTERYQRHRHTLGNGSDETACHRADNSHCPAGHTETGGHGAQKCRKNDNPDTIFTRIQHLLIQGWKTEEAAFDALMETLQKEVNKASEKLEDIDWKNFATDSDEQQKLLDVINPVLQLNGMEVYTINDVKNLWADIEWYGRAGTGAAACGAAIDVTLARLTKGKSLKPKARASIKRAVEAACGIGAASVPVPDTDDDKTDNNDDDDGEQPTPTTQQPTPTTEAPKKVTGADVQKAGEDLEAGDIDLQQYLAIQNRWYCQLGMKRFC